MTDFSLRWYRPGDLPLILSQAAGTGWSRLTPREQARAGPEQVARQASQLIGAALAATASVCIVAADPAGRVLAYELLALRRDEVSGLPEALKVDGWVDPAHRGQGLNRVMHQAGEDWCRQAGVERMVCVVAAHNEPAIRATGKSGFQTERLIRAKWVE